MDKIREEHQFYLIQSTGVLPGSRIRVYAKSKRHLARAHLQAAYEAGKNEDDEQPPASGSGHEMLDTPLESTEVLSCVNIFADVYARVGSVGPDFGTRDALDFDKCDVQTIHW